jgi:hypothetical protein
MKVNQIRRFLLLSGCAWFAGMATPWPAMADAPSGKPVLTVNGKISNKNAGDRFVFDMATLEKLPQHSFRTRTPWYPEAREFTGPLLRDVLAAVGTEGKRLTAYALNNYKAEIPVKDAGDYDVIVARLIDGKPLPIRDKGPLFIIYPFDDHTELRSQTYYGRSAWQLKEIRVN